MLQSLPGTGGLRRLGVVAADLVGIGDTGAQQREEFGPARAGAAGQQGRSHAACGLGQRAGRGRAPRAHDDGGGAGPVGGQQDVRGSGLGDVHADREQQQTACGRRPRAPLRGRLPRSAPPRRTAPRRVPACRGRAGAHHVEHTAADEVEHAAERGRPRLAGAGACRGLPGSGLRTGVGGAACSAGPESRAGGRPGGRLGRGLTGAHHSMIGHPRHVPPQQADGDPAPTAVAARPSGTDGAGPGSPGCRPGRTVSPPRSRTRAADRPPRSRQWSRAPCR
ncbi:hypothetical protein ACU686_15400 [Yinghuangia aomiensis]